MINLNDIKLTPELDSVFRAKISDEEYFSSNYSDFISNSRLRLINPEQGGSPSLYKQGLLNEVTPSLMLGSAIHELFLQPECFTLGPLLKKPNAKLGLVVDAIRDYRKLGFKIEESIKKACLKIHYYENMLNNNKIRFIIENGLYYYLKSKEVTDDNVILLSDRDYNIVKSCTSNLLQNNFIQELVQPLSLTNNKYSFNEEAFFINIKAQYEDKKCLLKLKMKVDNWTIDLDNKIIVLNDLKTTGYPIESFMENSFIKYRYYRQFGMYLWMLLRYCELKYNYNPLDWNIRCNVIVVETNPGYNVCVYPINNYWLEKGRREFCRLLKMVAYCEMNNYSDDIIFI